MRGGVVPPALLFVALGLALAFASCRVRTLSVALLFFTVAVLSFFPVPRAWLEGVFLGCWLSVIITAACVHLRRGLAWWAAVALSLNAGIWACGVVSLSASRLDLLKALPCVLIALPASWVIARYASIPVKVLSSWVIAVAFLAASLQFLPVTPGYLPDHLE